MAGNAGMGRRKGTRNKSTEATLALANEGETPLELMTRVSRDTNVDMPIRLNAARWAAPYLHPKPFPEMPMAEFSLPESITTVDGLLEAHAGILKAVAAGDLAVPLARDLSAIVEAQRRLVETSELEARITRLEVVQSQTGGNFNGQHSLKSSHTS
jgi:hypothetical protein